MNIFILRFLNPTKTNLLALKVAEPNDLKISPFRLTEDDFNSVMKKYPKERKEVYQGRVPKFTYIIFTGCHRLETLFQGALKHWEDKNKKILNNKRSSNLVEDIIDDLDIPIDGYPC